MRMKFVTTDKMYESLDEITAKLQDGDAHRNQLMFELATIKNTLLEYTHKKDFYAYQEQV